MKPEDGELDKAEPSEAAEFRPGERAEPDTHPSLRLRPPSSTPLTASTEPEIASLARNSVGAMLGAFTGPMFGGLLALLLGGLGRKFGDVPAATIGAFLGGLLPVLLFARGRLAARTIVGWVIAGVLLWAAAWYTGSEYLHWNLAATLIPCSLGGAIIATLGVTHSELVAYARCEEEVPMRGEHAMITGAAVILAALARIVPDGRGRRILAGALGGLAGGALAGSIFWGFSGESGRTTLPGVMWFALGAGLLGLCAGAVGGAGIGRAVQPMPGPETSGALGGDSKP